MGTGTAALRPEVFCAKCGVTFNHASPSIQYSVEELNERVVSNPAFTVLDEYRGRHPVAVIDCRYAR